MPAPLRRPRATAVIVLLGGNAVRSRTTRGGRRRAWGSGGGGGQVVCCRWTAAGGCSDGRLSPSLLAGFGRHSFACNPRFLPHRLSSKDPLLSRAGACWCALRVCFDPRLDVVVCLTCREAGVSSPLLRAPARRVCLTQFHSRSSFLAPPGKTPDHVCCRTTKNSCRRAATFRYTKALGDNKRGKGHDGGLFERINFRLLLPRVHVSWMNAMCAVVGSCVLFELCTKKSRVKREPHRPHSKCLRAFSGHAPCLHRGEDKLPRTRPVERCNSLVVCLLVRLFFSWCPMPRRMPDHLTHWVLLCVCVCNENESRHSRLARLSCQTTRLPLSGMLRAHYFPPLWRTPQGQSER